MTDDRWSVFGVRADKSWWRVYDSRSEGAPMTKAWAVATADYLNNSKSVWKGYGTRYEAHPYDWTGEGANY